MFNIPTLLMKLYASSMPTRAPGSRDELNTLPRSMSPDLQDSQYLNCAAAGLVLRGDRTFADDIIDVRQVAYLFAVREDRRVLLYVIARQFPDQ